MKANESAGPVRLNLGCGVDIRPGWINVDLWVKADEVVPDNIVALGEFEPASADEILASHSLEHLSQEEALQALRRWYEVLKSGGLLTVVVPDVIFNLRLFLEFWERNDPRTWDFRAKTIWGNQNHGGEYHRWGYDEAQLRQAFEQTGFVDVKVYRVAGMDFDLGEFPDSCFRATGRRPA